MFISVKENKKSFIKNKKKSLFIVPCLKITNIPKSIVQDLGIENISNNSYEFFCKPNNINLIPTIRENNILTVGLGNEDKTSLQVILDAFSKINFRALPNKDIFLICDNLISDGNKLSEILDLLSLNIIFSVYSFPKNKKTINVFHDSSKIKLTFLCNSSLLDIKKILKINNILGNSVNSSRIFSDLPANICTPEFFSNTTKKLNGQKNLKVKVLGKSEIKKLKMGSFLSVSQGSVTEPKFVIMEHLPLKNKAPIVFVGKGVTFDTGGISLKPSSSMDEMKYDMCGASTVVGLLNAINKLNLKINVVGLIPLTENMPSGSATKPGDVVTSMDGTTIEILNTDAEGRLILCDALSYSKKYKPKYVIDIATLTGACVVALGNENTGLFSNDQKLAKKLLHSGKKSLDTAWEMPLGDNYRKLLKSNFADIANIGGRMAGSITAACFLEHFAKDLKWAHLDIAGTAWKSNNKKATGRPIPLLMNFVLNEANDSN